MALVLTGLQSHFSAPYQAADNSALAFMFCLHRVSLPASRSESSGPSWLFFWPCPHSYPCTQPYILLEICQCFLKPLQKPYSPIFPSSLQFSSVQLLSCVQLLQLFVTPWTAAHQASLSISNSQSLLKRMSIESMMPSNHLILCHPLLLLPSVFPSIRVFFQWVSSSHQVAKALSFSFSISPSNEYSGLISFRIGLNSLQSKGLSREFSNTVVQKHQFFSAQLSSWSNSSIHDYWKTIALTIRTFVGKVISLFFNILSRLVIAFLPMSKRCLISQLQSPSAVILEPKKIKSVTVSIVFPSICHEVMGPDVMMFVFWMFSFKPIFSFLFHFHQEAL